MVNLKRSNLLLVFVGFLTALMFVNAANFSVSPASIADSINVTDTLTATFTVTNDGANPVNLSLSESDLTIDYEYKSSLDSDNRVISASLSKTSISNLAGGASEDVNLTVTAENTKGVFKGTITVVNAQNSSETVSIPVTITVNQPEDVDLEIYSGGTTYSITGDKGATDVNADIRLNNTGDIDVTVAEIIVDGDIGKIPKRDLVFHKNDFGDTISKGTSRVFDAEIDLDDNDIDQDETYTGTIIVVTEEGFDFEFTIEVNVEPGELELEFDDDTFTLFGEPGKTIRTENEFIVENTGDTDARNLVLRVEENLEKEGDSSTTLAKELISFDISEVNVDDGDEEDYEITIDVPEDQEVGTYNGEIVLVSQDGTEEYASMNLKVKIIGDVYIKSIICNNKIDCSDVDLTPGSNLDVKVEVANQGASIYRDVKVIAILQNIDRSNTDLDKSSSTFLLNSNSDRTETLRFFIPEDASDGSHTLEIRVKYGDEELIEIESVNIDRPSHNIEISGEAINPSTVKCQDSIYTYLKLENLGKYDERVKIRTSVLGTTVSQETDTFDLNVDEIVQRTMVLDVSNLEAGNYTIEQKVLYGSSSVERSTHKLIVNECRDTSVGVDVKPINQTNQTVNETTEDSTINIGGNEIPKETVYLGAGLAAVIVLIVISLFFL
ncbi:MAG: hypothetical protein ACOCXG_00895 [Nanoarchaeota archaeon]